MLSSKWKLFWKFSSLIHGRPLERFTVKIVLYSYHRHRGRVRTKTVKKAAKIIIEKYYTRLTLDFDTNKRICEEIAIIPTKPLRNKIAGFTTHLMRRLRHSQVRGISIKLQEEERERRDNYVPEVSALEHDIIEVDPDTKDMLKMLDFNNINGLQLTQPATQSGYGGRRN